MHLWLQVTELKGLANHVVVGSVSCETKDLFAALPQVVAVDINDLGTIKLSLEVIWRLVGLKGLGVRQEGCGTANGLLLFSPFDKDDQPSTASTVNKASTVTKRFSTYSQSPPDTPSLREQAFYVSHSLGPCLTIFQGLLRCDPKMFFPLLEHATAAGGAREWDSMVPLI
jgi:hypothetical protein